MDAAPLVIRPACAADGPAIAAVILPVIRAGTTYALDPAMSEAEALAEWLAPDKVTFVAEDAAGVVGTYYLRANHTGGGAHVANCGYITHPQAGGRGIGAAMALHSLDQARARGFRAVQFNFVVSTNTSAVRLWERLGFATVGRLPGAFHHPEHGDVDALVMHRVL